MATLIPALGSCTARMTPGERRVAERLEQKLDADYLLWYDVPVGPRQLHPDFIVLHPRRGLLVLEVKDWRLDTIREANRNDWLIAPDGVAKTVANPFEQARQYVHCVVDLLKRDPQLVQGHGSYQGQLAFPWSCGVVLPNITRQQFEAAGLEGAIQSARVLCKDEMLESTEAEDLQSRLWGMFPYGMRGALSLPQIDRIRWNLFPQVRVPAQGALFDGADAEELAVPDLVKVFDLQQEQLARSLGDGHRVIHGVAGSGKTMILGYRAAQLAQAGGPKSKPVLVLCFNRPLAQRLAQVIGRHAAAERVAVQHFHVWCRRQLLAFGQALPADNLPTQAKMEDMVQRVIQAVDRGHIPRGQYQAVLVDEAHDFAPEWLKLIAQMVDPTTNSLLILYDGAQRINDKAGKAFSLRSVGIQAQGRTTVLKINYRNTRQVLQTAQALAAQAALPERAPAPTGADDDDDSTPLVPLGCGREGPDAILVHLPDLPSQAARVADLLASAHGEGHSWSDMAVLCRDRAAEDLCAAALSKRRLPHSIYRSGRDFDGELDTIKVMSMRVSKGLEFPVVAVVDTESSERRPVDPRLLYVAATRATHRLICTRR